MDECKFDGFYFLAWYCYYYLMALITIRYPWTRSVFPWMVGFFLDYFLLQLDRNDPACLHGYLWSQNGSSCNDYSSVRPLSLRDKPLIGVDLVSVGMVLCFSLVPMSLPVWDGPWSTPLSADKSLRNYPAGNAPLS